MIAASFTGNTVVCFKLLTSRRHHFFKTQVLFLNLALADLLVTSVTMSSQLIWEIMGRQWIAGDLFCRFLKVLQTYSLVSSTYMLVSVAIDRHFAIVNPLSPAPKPRSLACAAWVLSLVPSLPNVFLFRLVAIDNNKCYCASLFYIHKEPPISRQVYMAFVFSSVFIVPLVLLVALYTTILVEMWKLGAYEHERKHSTATGLPRARVRTLRMAIVIFVAFVITNVPYMVQEMVLAFARDITMDKNLVAIFGVISASNSAINPYIYLSFNSKRCRRGGSLWFLAKQSGSKDQCYAQGTPVIIRFKARPVNAGHDCNIKRTDVFILNHPKDNIAYPGKKSSSEMYCRCK